MFDPQNPPALAVSRWFNTEGPRALADYKGRVLILAAFQMNCPGSQKHGLPQAERLARSFSDDEIAVVGLNTAFEEHGQQTEAALEEFIGAKHLSFPIGKDQPNGSDVPKTMAAYEIQGTPAILIFDRQGRLRRHYLGQVDDIRIAAEAMALAMEAPNAPHEQSMAVERRLAAALVDPDAHHHHDHDHAGGCCGGAHAHDHDHDHQPATTEGDHAKAEGGCGDEGCGCKH